MEEAMLAQLSSSIDFSQFIIQNKEPADEADKDIKKDKKLLFNKPSVLYNEVLGGLEDEVIILKTEEDNDLWLNNMEVLHNTILGDPYQNISEKEPVVTYLPNNY
jgi:hypothetical protein